MNAKNASSRPAASPDRLSAMAAFVRVVEAGSFSRAARDLGVAQPTVSKQIAALEARYAVRLLERTTRRVRPTDDGRAFYLHAKNLLAEFDDLEAAARRSARAPGGKLRLS